MILFYVIIIIIISYIIGFLFKCLGMVDDQ